MLPSDRQAFATALQQLFSAYNEPVSPDLLAVWWDVLGAYQLRYVQVAFRFHVADPKAGMYRPTPAHVMVHLTETIPDRLRARQAAVLADLANQLVVHRETIGRAATDSTLGLIGREEGLARITEAHAAIQRLEDSDPVRAARRPIELKDAASRGLGVDHG